MRPLRNGSIERYDLTTDPNERHNLIDQSQHAADQQDLRARLEGFFTTYANPTCDLTRGGKSKAAGRELARRGAKVVLGARRVDRRKKAF